MAAPIRGSRDRSSAKAELRTIELFAGAMGWPWQGGVGFGGTSPIDGRPFEEAGMFSKQLRACVPLVAGDIAAGRPFSPRTVARCDTVPFPMPLPVTVWIVNSGTRKTAGAGAGAQGTRVQL